MRRSSGRQFAMCSNISTETTRSNRPAARKSFMSAVMTSRLVRPRAAPRRLMEARCECEFDTDVICAARIMPRHPERQRTPAAAELEDALAVGKRGMRGGGCKRAFLRRGERVDAVVIKAARIFALRPEHQREELCRDFVVLRIGRLDMHRRSDKAPCRRKAPVGIAPMRAQLAGASARQASLIAVCVTASGQGNAFADADQRLHDSSWLDLQSARGGAGKNALVRA